MKERTNISLSPESMEMLKKLAKDAHVSVSGWVNQKIWEEARKADLHDKLVEEFIKQANQ